MLEPGVLLMFADGYGSRPARGGEQRDEDDLSYWRAEAERRAARVLALEAGNAAHGARPAPGVVVVAG